MVNLPTIGPWDFVVPGDTPNPGQPNWSTSGNRAPTVNFVIGADGAMHAPGFGAPPNSMVYFLGTELPAPLQPLTGYRISPQDWSVDYHKLSYVPGGPTIELSGTYSGDVEAYNDFLSELTTSATSSVETIYKVKHTGGGAGGNPIGGGGAGTTCLLALCNIPPLTKLRWNVGGGGLGSHFASAPTTPTRGTDTWLWYYIDGQWRKLSVAQGGKVATPDGPGTTRGPGRGSDAQGSQFAWYDPTNTPEGIVIPSSDLPLNAGDGGMPNQDGCCSGGASFFGGPLNVSQGGGAEGSGGGYNPFARDAQGQIDPYGYDGFHGRVLIEASRGPY